MSDVVAIALISGIGSVIIAVTGVLAQYWGPEWREERARRRLADDTEGARRYERALEFLEALGEYARAERERLRHRASLSAARARFVATLRPGETGVEVFTRRVIEEVMAVSPAPARLTVLDRRSDLLFRWLRAEATIEDLDIPVTPSGFRRLISNDGDEVHVLPQRGHAPPAADLADDAPEEPANSST